MVELIERTARVPAVATSRSVVAALRSFGAQRISVATPYPEWNNQRLRAYLAAQGFEVLNLEAEPEAARAGNQGISDQDPAVIVEFASRCRPDADALLCSCTALHRGRGGDRATDGQARRHLEPVRHLDGAAAARP
jgi:maleate cis-trans isomerase